MTKKKSAPKKPSAPAATAAEQRDVDLVIKSIAGLGDNELALAHEALQAELFRRSQAR